MKVILIAAISADGKIAERANQTSLDWTSKEDTKFFVEKTKEVGVVIMGSKTFATIGKPLKGRRVIVLSRGAVGRDVSGPTDLSPLFPPTSRHHGGEPVVHIPSEGTVEFTNSSPHQLLERLEQQGHDAVVVAGGASVYSQFLSQGLVTDLYLTIEPVLFGGGVSLASGFERIKLKLIETRLIGEQSLVLHYVI